MFKEKRDIERTDEDHIIVDGVKLKAEERSRNFCDGCFFFITAQTNVQLELMRM